MGFTLPEIPPQFSGFSLAGAAQQFLGTTIAGVQQQVLSGFPASVQQFFSATGFSGAGGIDQTAYIIPQGVFGTIAATVTLEESYHDQLVLTEHPVEVGAMITDHSFKRPAEVTMRCGWSNSDFDANNGLTQPSITGGGGSTSDYVTSIYLQLLSLQESRTPFQLQTSIRLYDNMLITSIGLTRDSKSSQALFCTIGCREVILVSTSTSTLPPTANQATPADTQGTVSTGSTTPQSTAPQNTVSKPQPNTAPTAPTPSNGGAVPANAWTATIEQYGSGDLGPI